MPARESPPHSPPLYFHPDDIEFDENDMAEVIETGHYNMGGEMHGGQNPGIVTESDNAQEENEVIPERDDAHMILAEHQGDVLCCQFHPEDNGMVVTGGVDNQAIIWNSSNGTKLFACKGHEESVEIAVFSYDGSYLATGDLNGVIKVWRVRDFELIATMDLEDELSWMMWHSGINVLVASSHLGMIYMYKMPGGETKLVLASFGQSCFSGKILPDGFVNAIVSDGCENVSMGLITGKTLACGYQDGSLKIVDMKQGTVVKDVKPFEGVGGITCMDVHKSNGLIICGCECGSVVLINSNNGKVASILQGPQSAEGSHFIETVSFCKDPTYPVAASGSLSGILIIWDIARQTLRHKYNFTSCLNHLVWHPSLPLLFTCIVEGVAHAFDAKAGTVLKEYLGHKNSCLNMSLSSDGSQLITASEDKTARIYYVGDIFM